MIILADTGVSGYRYVIDRDEDSYTILEGNMDLFEHTAELMRENGDEKPYYRMVLSCEEPELDLEKMTEIYYDFKDLFFKNYDENEYQLFSVIHWDDEHPHIHVGIIRNSMVNNKKLRLIRFGHDTKRIDSIAEIINYKHGLSSAKENVSLMKTTPEQKKRDWQVKKGAPWSEVEDDNIHYFFRISIKQVSDFADFKKKIEGKYPDVEFYDYERSNGEKTININGRAFTSFLFNEDWFNKNLDELKKNDNLKGSIPRENAAFYKELYEYRTKEHADELNSRGIHKGLLEFKLENGLINLPQGSTRIDERFEVIQRLRKLDLKYKKDRDRFKKDVESFDDILLCKEDFELFLGDINAKLDKFDFDKRRGGGYISIEKDGKKMYIENNKLYDACCLNKDDLDYLSKKDTLDVEFIKEQFAGLSSRKNEDLHTLRTIISSEVLSRMINNKDELISFLGELDLQIINSGTTISRGNYITVAFKGKRVSVYDNHIHDVYNEIQSEDTKIVNKNDILDSVSRDEFFREEKPESITEYKLTKADDIDFIVLNKNYEKFEVNDLLRDRNRPCRIEDDYDAIVLEKSIDDDKSSNIILDMISKRDWEYVRLVGDIHYQESMIENMMYLTKGRDVEWMDKIIIDCDLYDSGVFVKNGTVFDVNQRSLFNGVAGVDSESEAAVKRDISVEEIRAEVDEVFTEVRKDINSRIERLIV